MISIYYDPASKFAPTYAQRGLPYLPKFPNTQFNLLKQWIHLCDEKHDSLPKTFQDAVTVTRSLGIPYLWIDSLCIIQEDEKDWESEAARMEEVFSFAYFTIAASRGTSSLSGFLGERKPRAYVEIQTSSGPLYLAEAIDDFHADVEESELSKRGWPLYAILNRKS
ncbi:hypothetical protein TsFJ059_000137 [Trichoderma semiorbis]|uniref:Heterokaryon incompatibility domain-containing protein n=1 Tax=Trichoderma semiorbis TaxID=1491008 RepID=A0A9P8HNW8_9HYPO|nr:hypothetical protein TsFJ059_000137 [Trichoderma semiorbis]